MRPALALLATLPLLACVAAGPAPTSAGSVEVLDQSYPIEVLPNGVWRARVGNGVVVCAKPTAQACAGSVRHALDAQMLLDDLG